MDGHVGMHSTPGHGSRFWAELPLPQTDAPVIDPRMEAQDIERLAGLRVLLVEDNPVNMMIGVAMLEQWGIEVTQAVDGAEGVAAVERACAAQRPFHVVLMDVQMPRLSGHEAARRLRKLHPKEKLPIIALTAAALVSEREEALAAGMNDFSDQADRCASAEAGADPRGGVITSRVIPAQAEIHVLRPQPPAQPSRTTTRSA